MSTRIWLTSDATSVFERKLLKGYGGEMKCVYYFDDVEVKNDTIIAHLSLWQLTKTVIGYAVTFVVVVVLALVMLFNPEWGGARRN